MILAHGTILLVVDGSRMMILRNTGDALSPELSVIEHRTIDSLPNRDILADAPGVGSPSMGFGRDTYDRADPHQVIEDRFVGEAAAALSEALKQHDGKLIVIAPPTALGVLRSHYDSVIKARLITEIAKDLTRHPVDDIARMLLAR